MKKNKTYHKKKVWVVFWCCILLLSGLVGRLIYLMGFCSDYYYEKAQNLYERERSIKAARGRILDAKGKVLADNKTVRTVSVIHNQIREPERVIQILSRELGMDEEEIRKRVEKRSSIEKIRTNVEKETGDAIRIQEISHSACYNSKCPDQWRKQGDSAFWCGNTKPRRNLRKKTYLSSRKKYGIHGNFKKTEDDFGICSFKGGWKNAKIGGYAIGGKTATSQTLPRSANRYISSFLAFAPAENPEILGLCIIHDPKGIYYGGTIAAPVMKSIFENVLPYLGIKKTKSEEKKQENDVG